MNASDKTGRRKRGGGGKRRVRVGRDALVSHTLGTLRALQNPDFEKNNLFVLQSTNYITACMLEQPFR